jgi:aryl-alcohol dehydrogenase-like predicted oxidoreductase
VKFRALGSTGVQVSQLCFGTMSFGGDADEAASAKMFGACREAGINPAGSDVNARGGSRRHILRAAEASLKRLQTDRVEVLFLHQYDPLTPAEETLRALEDLVRAGKVLYPAVSNYAAWQTQRALDIQRQRGWAPLQVTQPMYNLVKRQAEVEILPMAAANGIGVTPYSPAGGGLLSGKYSAKGTSAAGGAPAGRIATNKMYENRYGDPWMHEVAAAFAAFCKARGFHPMSAAVAWVGSHPAVTAPIIGARSLEQLQASLDSVKVDMTPELRAEIAALSRTPPPATDRLEEIKKP